MLAGLDGSPAATGAILDRGQLLELLNAAIRECIADGVPGAVILVDINNFAEINAAWGPTAGDGVIAAAGSRLRDVVAGQPARDFPVPAEVGRLDADHFAVILPQARSAERLASLAGDLVHALAQPFELSGHHIGLGARAAIVRVPEHGRSVTTVLGRGFHLLNSEARSRGDAVATWSSAMAPSGQGRLGLERDLAAAIPTDRLFIALQPKVHVATGSIRGAEALVRWNHPDRGLVPPPLLIEAAEKSGLIFDLGLRILRDACRAGKRLAASGRDITIGVNVSPYQLAHPDFLSRFLAVIDEEGVAPNRLEVEITETAAMMGGDKVADNLRSLKRCGMSLAIDDFGTGFSNLASLSALPADTLKIDRSLVVGVDKGEKATALLDVAVQLGRRFGMAIVAEGVETRQQFDHVTELGCDYVQGYLTGKAVSAEDFGRQYLDLPGSPPTA